jgi:thiol-disulfide isomerase/thioredoxin
VNDWLEYTYWKDHKDETPQERFEGYMEHIRKITRNGVLRQALIADYFNEFIDQNETEKFEQFYPYFTKNVSNPILKLSIRDRYLSRKSFKDDPSVLTNAILYPDKISDRAGSSAKVNDGVLLLRNMVEQNERKVIYINIGAHWCRGCVEERPYQWKMAEMFKDEPLKIVNIIIGANMYPDRDSLSTFGTIIEDYLLTDEQFYGIDHIVKLGNNGIPYYILINKEGLIVDYGSHLRPSMKRTLEIIKELLDE